MQKKTHWIFLASAILADFIISNDISMIYTKKHINRYKTDKTLKVNEFQKRLLPYFGNYLWKSFTFQMSKMVAQIWLPPTLEPIFESHSLSKFGCFSTLATDWLRLRLLRTDLKESIVILNIIFYRESYFHSLECYQSSPFFQLHVSCRPL